MEDFGLEDGDGRSSIPIVKDKNLEKKGSNEVNISKMLKHTHIRSGSSGSDSSSVNRSNTNQDSKKASVDSEKVDSDPAITLPQRFVVKYLGVRETSNLWGIKYTRDPVDHLVGEAKRLLSSAAERTLPLLKLEVAENGITVGPMPQNTNPNFPLGRFPIESISYGVQDLVYTRVFAMIVVKPESSKKEESSKKLSELSKLDDGQGSLPYRCHVFVTDTRETAKNLTHALAAAFQKFSHKVTSGKVKVTNANRVASIDLRPVDDEVLADSEA